MKKLLVILIAVIFFPVAAQAAYGDTTTYISRIYFGDGKHRLNAFFDFPDDITVNKKGGFVIADTFNNVIRRIKPSGKVKTIAGTGSYGDTVGGASKAEFALPRGVAISSGAIYVADTDNDKIKKIKDGLVTVLASGLNKPEGVAVYGNTVYFLDTGINALKKVNINGGAVTQISGSLNDPKKLAITGDGKYAYVADAGSHKIRQIHLATGVISTVAGTGKIGSKNGSCNTATFDQLWGIHLQNSKTIYVSDGNGFDDTVRKIDLNDCTVTTFASDVNMVSLNFPKGLTTYKGKLYVAATGIGIIEQYDLADANNHKKFAGANRFNVKKKKPVLTGNPKYLVLSKNKKRIFFSENNRIRSVKRSNLKDSKLVSGNVIDNYNKNDNKSYFGEVARYSDIPSFVRSKNGRKLFVVDRNNNRIREVIIKTGETKYLTGAGRINLTGGQQNDFQNGTACPNEKSISKPGCAYFNRPTGSVLSKDGKFLYVADSGNNRIRRVTVRGTKKGNVKTIAGNAAPGFADGVGKAAKFNAPIGLTRSRSGRVLYVADRDNHRIRKINLRTRAVTTYAGAGFNGYLDAKKGDAQFSFPEWITRGRDGNLYISEVGGQRIRMIDRIAKVTKLVAGNGERGFRNSGRFNSEFNNPRGLLALPKKLLVAELFNDQIRSISLVGDAPYTNPAPQVNSVTTPNIGKEWFDGATAKIEVKGANFRHGAIAYVGPHKAVNTFVNAADVIVMEIPITAMSPGYYTVRIENSDGQYNDLIRGLAVSQGGLVPEVDFWP